MWNKGTDIDVLVTETLPKEIERMGMIDSAHIKSLKLSLFFVLNTTLTQYKSQKNKMIR